MQKYRILGKKGEGTFSEVLRAVNLKTEKQVAIKCMKRKFCSIDEVNNLSEIQALKKLAGHPNIVALHEVLFEEGRLAIVFDLMDMNGYEAIKDRRSYLSEAKVAKWMMQMAQALHFMHKCGIAHRDIKPENILIKPDGHHSESDTLRLRLTEEGDILKLADLGSCTSINSRPPHTEYISTRWYRSPETLLTSGHYTPVKMDIWAFACVFYELMALTPLFPGKDEMDQINRIHAVLGTPGKDVLAMFRRHANGHLRDIQFGVVQGVGFARKLSHCSSQLVDLLGYMLTYSPDERPTSRQVLKHPYFASRLQAADSVDSARTIAKFPAVGLQTPVVAAVGATSHLLLNSTARAVGFGLPPIAPKTKTLAPPAAKFKKQPAFMGNNTLFSQTGLSFLRPLR